MSFTDFLENEVLDHLWGNAAYAPPATWYIGLSTSTPADDGSNFTEPVGAAYARIGITNNATEWPAAAAGAKANANAAVFVQATGAWGTLTHYGVFDAVSGGNLVAVGELSTPTLIGNGDDPTIPAGDITINLD